MNISDPRKTAADLSNLELKIKIMEEYIKMSLESYNRFLLTKAECDEILQGDKTIRMSTRFHYTDYVFINADEATKQMAIELADTRSSLSIANEDLRKIRSKWWYRLFN